MSRTKTFAAVIALGLGASACAPTGEPLSASNNPSLYSVHQPVVERTDFVLDLSANGDRLSASELDRLDAWLVSIDVRYGDRISIDEPRGYPNVLAREDIARVAAGHGLLLTDGAPILQGSVPPGSIRVVASRATASVPGCPDWSDPVGEPNVSSSANWGCASNSNLAAMIANPEDLIHGQDSDEGSATTAGRAIRVYRNRTPSGAGALPSTTPSGSSGGTQ